MKVAILCESPSDELALRVLLDGIAGTQFTYSHPRLRARGWPSVMTLVGPTIRQLYYNTNVDALAIVADSDDSPPHSLAHERAGGIEQACRYCQLAARASAVVERLRPRNDRALLKVAVGVAVPAIEAWFACGKRNNSEAVYARRLKAGSSLRETRRALKRLVYGSQVPDEMRRLRGAQESAGRCLAKLEQLERLFPGGFGTFATAVRGWVT